MKVSAAVEILEDRCLLTNVGYYDMSAGQGVANQVGPITAAGETPVALTDLTSADLAGIDVLFVQNPSNSSYGSEYVARLADIQNAVNSGMVLIIHDRFVTPAETILPGGAGFNIVRDFSDPSNIDVLNPTSLVTNGPGGIVTNTTLDGGNFSSHGFTFEASLPGSADLMLSTGNPTHIVTFAYQFGAGNVLYSAIPLDFYLAGSGPAVVSSNMRNIYAPNVVAWGADAAVPRPTVANPISDLSVNEDAPNTVLNLSATFAPGTAGDTLTLSVTGNTNTDLVTASMSGTNLTLSYAADQHGDSDITVRATDQNGRFEEDTFTVTVNPVNDAPVVDLNGSDGTGIDFATTFTEDGGAVAIVDTDLIVTDVDGGIVGSAVSGSGDIFVVNIDGRIVKIDPNTGLQTAVNSGAAISAARGMTIEPSSGDLLVTDAGFDRIVRVNPDTGVETVVSSGGLLSGSPWDIEVDGNGDLIVSNFISNGRLIRVDPGTGTQTLITSSGLLSGGSLGVAIEADGNILVSVFSSPRRIVRVNPTTGAQTLLSSGGFLSTPDDLTLEADGNILVADRSGRVIRVDRVSGVQTLLSSGGNLRSTFSVVVAANGDIFTTNFGFDSLVKVDPSSGAQTVVTQGNLLTFPLGAAIDAVFSVDTVTSATVTITNLLDGANESLSAVTSGTNVTASYNSTTGVLSLTGEDTAENYQTVLRTVTYNNTSQNPNTANRIIEFVANDGIDESAPPAITTLTIDAVNDAPVNTVPGAQSATEDIDLVIGGISVADVDAGSADVQVTLSVINGTLNVNTGVASGLAAGDVSGNGSAAVVLIGTLTEINNTLASASGLTYRGNLNFSGSDTLTVVTNDQGNTGAGGAQMDTDTVAVTVTAVADPPILSVSNVTGDEGSAIPLLVSAALFDTDGSESLSITIGGVPGNAILSAGTNIGGGVFTLTPTQLSGLTITLPDDANFNLTVTATSVEASNGDSASTAGTPNVLVNNVAPVASLLTLSATTINEDGSVTGTELAARSIERGHRRIRHGPPPGGVQSAAIAVFPLAGRPMTHRPRFSQLRG